MKNFSLLIFASLVLFLSSCSLSRNECQEKKLNIDPITSGDIEFAPWGVQFNVLEPHSGIYIGDWDSVAVKTRIDSMVYHAAQMGVKWVRFSINWSTIQLDDGTFVWDYVDRTVEGLTKNDIEIILCLHGGHRAFTETMSVRGQEEIQAWRIMADAISKRYADKIQHWELWNEPNTVWFWKPNPSAKEYLKLLKVFHEVLSDNVDNPVLLGGSLARLDLPFADTLIQLGAMDYIDVMSIHPYGNFPEAILSPIRMTVQVPYHYLPADHSVYELIDKLEGSGTEVWQAECGYPSGANSLGWTGNGPWGDTIQAKWVLRRFMTDMIFGSPVSIIFTMKDYSYSNPDKINYKGFLRRDTYERKPSFHTFQHTTALLNGSVKAFHSDADSVVSLVEAGDFPGSKKGDVMSTHLKNEKHEFYAYWLKWRMQEHIHAPARVQIQLSSFDDPVLVDLIKGTYLSVEMNEQGVAVLPLSDYPLVIAERSNVK